MCWWNQQIHIKRSQLYYVHSKAATCFGRTCVHPQGDTLQRLYYKTLWTSVEMQGMPKVFYSHHNVSIYRAIQEDGLNWRVNGASTHARQLVAVFQVLCPLYGLTWRGLRSKLSWILLTFSSDTRGRPELLPLHRQAVCSNWWFQRQMLFLVGGRMSKRRRNARCTAVGDSVLMKWRTRKMLCCIVAILLSTDAAARL